MHFWKYQALGNDYLVVMGIEWSSHLNHAQVERVCHRNFGIGSDGILVDRSDHAKGEFSVQIFNPDGSEAEKSGNGLRIFARYLWDTKKVKSDPFTVRTKGGDVKCTVLNQGNSVSVEMGKVTFVSKEIPEKFVIDGKEFSFCFADIGNPHCVVLRDKAVEDEARQYGPLIENEKRFPNRTNVQFLEIIDEHNIKIEIWERGAGYTLASGSSSSASAAVSKKMGKCKSPVTVHMPGGTLNIEITDDFYITMHGPVGKVCEGELSSEVLKVV